MTVNAMPAGEQRLFPGVDGGGSKTSIRNAAEAATVLAATARKPGFGDSARLALAGRVMCASRTYRNKCPGSR